MARYIDVDLIDSAINEGLCEMCYSDTAVDCRRKCLQTELHRFVTECATADVVPVVRCRECDYMREQHYTGKLYCVAEYGSRLVKPEGFCSEGKRMEGKG